MPAGIAFDPLTGTFSGTPVAAAAATTITITATDLHGKTVLETFALTIVLNNFPAFTNLYVSPANDADLVNNVGENFNFNLIATDPDGDAITYSFTKPVATTFLTIAVSTLSGNGGIADAGSHAITAKACDIWGACVEQSFTVIVNQVPVLDAGMAA